jgi:hypothetical protein
MMSAHISHTAHGDHMVCDYSNMCERCGASLEAIWDGRARECAGPDAVHPAAARMREQLDDLAARVFEIQLRREAETKKRFEGLLGEMMGVP